MTNLKSWLHGLGAAFIGGASTAGYAAFVAPDTFNFTHAGILALGKMLLLGALVPTFAYLKQSPLPKQ